MKNERRKAESKAPVLIEPSRRNVFADLVLKGPEERLAEAELVRRISDIIEERKLTEHRAAG